jgi:predicted DNA-binding protein (MmcQ/YjbR family)
LSLEVRGKRFGWFLDDHHGDGRLALNLKAPPGANQTLAAKASERFHVPKYVGHRGWIGVWLDSPAPNWNEIKKLLQDAYRLKAPKRLVKVL